MEEKKIKLTKSEGAIVFRENSIPEIYAPVNVGEECDSVRFTLAFLLYAVEREDWITEFEGFVDTIDKKHRDLDVDIKRSKFEVIDGGIE